jgi:hypothetical protein
VSGFSFLIMLYPRAANVSEKSFLCICKIADILINLVLYFFDHYYGLQGLKFLRKKSRNDIPTVKNSNKKILYNRSSDLFDISLLIYHLLLINYAHHIYVVERDYFTVSSNKCSSVFLKHK